MFGVGTSTWRGLHILLAVTMAAGFLLTLEDIGGYLAPYSVALVLAPPIAFLSIVSFADRWLLLQFLDSFASVTYLGTVAVAVIQNVHPTALGLSWMLACGALALIGTIVARRQLLLHRAAADTLTTRK